MRPKGVTESIDIDAWVYSHSPGIWQVYRVIQGVQKLRFSLHDRQRVDKRQLVLSKRLADENWKPSFKNEIAAGELVERLTETDKQRLDQFIAAEPQILLQFKAFEPKAIDLAMDLPLNVPASASMEHLENLINDVFGGIDHGMSNEMILVRLASSTLANYAPKTMRNAILRFISKDHEVRNGEYVFREAQLVSA